MDWSINLNQDVVEEIASRLDSHADYTRFRAVCKTWHSFLPRFTKNHLPCELPSLMLFQSGYCDFFSLFAGDHGEVYKLPVPLVENTICRGSSKGWLTTIDDSTLIRLVNPLKPDTSFYLPPMYTLPDVIEYRHENTGREYLLRVPFDFREGIYENVPVNLPLMKHTHVHKVVLSCSPNKEDCVAMVVYNENYQLACCRLGDKRWRSVDQGWYHNVEGKMTGWWSMVEDVVHHHRNFFMVDLWGTVFVLADDQIMDEGSPPEPKLVVRAPDGFGTISYGRLYLAVGSVDELLVVNRHINWPSTWERETYKFDVYRLNLNSPSWSKVVSLDERVLFLGVNESFLVSSEMLPSLSCNRNCIYFTDSVFINDPNDEKQIVGCSDVGVFDLKSQNVKALTVPVAGYNDRKTMIWPEPLWIKLTTN